MIDRDKPELKRVLTKLANVYQRAVDSDLLDSYYVALKPLSLEAIRRACTRAMTECTYFPKPVELRSYAATSERPHYREIDGNPVYECLRCRDTGVEVLERFRADGKSLGFSAIPCLCPTGAAVEQSWQQPDSLGNVMAESAKENARKIRAAA